jgi:hypothetical protein
MAVRKTLPLSGAAKRFLAVNLLLLSLYNPSELSAVALVRTPEVPLSIRLAVLAVYAAVLVALGRQAWCGFQTLGVTVSMLLVTGSAALAWSLADALLATAYGVVVATGLLVASIVLSAGQVVAYYARQLSGQSPVLKHPP